MHGSNKSPSWQREFNIPFIADDDHYMIHYGKKIKSFDAGGKRYNWWDSVAKRVLHNHLRGGYTVHTREKKNTSSMIAVCCNFAMKWKSLQWISMRGRVDMAKGLWFHSVLQCYEGWAIPHMRVVLHNGTDETPLQSHQLRGRGGWSNQGIYATHPTIVFEVVLAREATLSLWRDCERKEYQSFKRRSVRWLSFY